MKVKFNILLGIILFCFSCNNIEKQENLGKTYFVDLQKETNPFEEIFSKVEVIPLETTDSGLIVYCNKIFPINDKLYIYDDWSLKLLAFNQTGEFEFQVGRKGQGPGEYLNMYDCIIDSASNNISILESYGRILQYDLNGKHKETIKLPSLPNYFALATINDNNWVTWSALEIEEDCIYVLDKTATNTIISYWKDDRMFNMNQQHPFFNYDGKVYFGVGLRQQVYEVTTLGLIPAYLWDFGPDNIKKSRLEYYLGIDHPSKRNKKIIDDIGTAEMPFVLENQYQNKTYSYVALRRETGIRPSFTHVLYNKKKNASFVFNTLDGNECKMNVPLYFGDDYLLVDVLYDNREAYKSILSESEYKKLEAMKEDDNPCLLKLYFKK